jgi:tetratricopeptide (TPR) repeat protein
MNTILRTSRAVGFSVAFIIAAAVVLPVAARADELKDGRAALQAGQYDQALKLFEKAASQGLAEGRVGVGQVWLRRLQYAKAMEAFQLAQKMDPNLAWPYYGQGEVLRRQDKCAEAVPLLQKATDIDHKFPEAQLALGQCLVATKQHEKAVESLNKGLNWGPKWKPKFMVALGDAELARDSLRDAGIWYTRAREESPEDPAPRRALGDFYIKRGTFESAAPEYQAAIEKDSTDVELRYKLGQALFYAQRYNDALEAYKDVVARDPEFAAGQFALGDLYYRSGQADPRRYAEGRPYLEKYTQMMPDDPKGWSDLGRTYYHLGMKDEALTAMNKAEQLGDKSKEMYRNRFRLFVDRREYDKAMADYERADPEPEDQLRMAQVLVFTKQPARAESLYTQMVTADSSSRNARFALNELGKMRFRDKDYPGAVSYFSRRIALDPNNDEAYYYIGLSDKEMKRYPEAVAALRQSVALADAKPERHFWLGIVYASVDSTPQAQKELTRAVELDSVGTSKNTGVALRQLGFYRLLAKDNAEAIRMLERAVQIDAQDVQAWVWLAQGYQNSGNRAKACEAYSKALAIDPRQPDALKGKKSLGC